MIRDNTHHKNGLLDHFVVNTVLCMDGLVPKRMSLADLMDYLADSVLNNRSFRTQS